jgi:hypothetical protein
VLASYGRGDDRRPRLSTLMKVTLFIAVNLLTKARPQGAGAPSTEQEIPS